MKKSIGIWQLFGFAQATLLGTLLHFLYEWTGRVGARVKGYYYWSHFDSLESLAGYQRKFGLVRVNLKTGERTRKKNWYYYQKLIKNNAVE